MLPDYFALLEIDPKVTQKDVQKAFQRISLIKNPRVFTQQKNNYIADCAKRGVTPNVAEIGKYEQQEEEAEDIWEEIVAAYEVLSDPARRAKYYQFWRANYSTELIPRFELSQTSLNFGIVIAGEVVAKDFEICLISGNHEGEKGYLVAPSWVSFVVKETPGDIFPLAVRVTIDTLPINGKHHTAQMEYHWRTQTLIIPLILTTETPEEVAQRTSLSTVHVVGVSPQASQVQLPRIQASNQLFARAFLIIFGILVVIQMIDGRGWWIACTFPFISGILSYVFAIVYVIVRRIQQRSAAQV